MADQFRTTVSAVFWTADTDAAQAQVETIKNALPTEDRDTVLATIEYVAGGRPEPEPETVPSELPPEPPEAHEDESA